MILARCSLGHIGVVRPGGVTSVTYPDGTTSQANVGWHIWPLRMFGRRWSSRNPKVIL